MRTKVLQRSWQIVTTIHGKSKVLDKVLGIPQDTLAIPEHLLYEAQQPDDPEV